MTRCRSERKGQDENCGLGVQIQLEIAVKAFGQTTRHGQAQAAAATTFCGKSALKDLASEQLFYFRPGVAYAYPQHTNFVVHNSDDFDPTIFDAVHLNG